LTAGGVHGAAGPELRKSVNYAILTLGCRVNGADSLAIEAALIDAGASTAAIDAADVVLVNTCSVTAAADQAARQAVRRVARANPRARVVVTGCYGSRCPEDLAGLPGVAAVFHNSRKDDPQALARAVLDLVGTTAPMGPGPCGASVVPGIAGRTVWTLAVQTGCGERCSYCVVPQTRGPGRSLAPDAVLRAIERRVADGFREVVLTGVHLGSYGRDRGTGESLASLLRTLGRALERGAVRVRVSSIEPMDCQGDVIDALLGHPCFAPHFHLPLQHASGRVLSLMRRPYSLARYAAVVREIRDRAPRAAIGSDVLVGFPGERDYDVDVLCGFLADSPLTHLHVFPYSDRPGTDASAMADKVPGAAVRDRAARVREVAARLQATFRRAQVGTDHEALTLEDGCRALTGNFCKVTIPAGHRRNEWVRLRITHEENGLHGVPVPCSPGDLTPSPRLEPDGA
jgi:threonylcarbamoyladenosine tRNA methylthiotransferase MtaB